MRNLNLLNLNSLGNIGGKSSGFSPRSISGLVGWWDPSDLSSVTKSSTATRMVFDGVDDTVKFGNVHNPGTDNFSLALRFKTSQSFAYASMFTKSNGGAPTTTYGWLFGLNLARPFFAIANANAGGFSGAAGTYIAQPNTGTQLNDNATHSMVVVVDRAAANVVIYVDGVAYPLGTTLGTLSTVSGSVSNTLALTVGGETDGSNMFSGTICDVMRFGSAITAEDAMAYHNRRPMTVVPTSFWQGYGNSAVNWVDITGTTTATIAGTPATTTASGETDGAISQINDKSGKGNHLVQATGANQPFLSPFGIKNRYAIRFTADPQVLAKTDTSFTGLGDKTVFSVWRYIGGTSYGNIFSMASTNGGAGFGSGAPCVGLENSATTKVFTHNAWVTTVGAISALTGENVKKNNISMYHRSGGISNGNGSAIRLDVRGETPAVGTGTQGWGTATGTFMFLGRQSANAGVASMNGFIGETIVYNRALTVREYEAVMSYLRFKWNT